MKAARWRSMAAHALRKFSRGKVDGGGGGEKGGLGGGGGGGDGSSSEGFRRLCLGPSMRERAWSNVELQRGITGALLGLQEGSSREPFVCKGGAVRVRLLSENFWSDLGSIGIERLLF